MSQYDYLVVGAGLSGAVFANAARKAGKSVLVIERRDHIAGNVYTEQVEGINVHRYGAHIFHTSMRDVWDYVNRFAEFNNYVNSPVANFRGQMYNMPFNMNTFAKMWPGVAQSTLACGGNCASCSGSACSSNHSVLEEKKAEELKKAEEAKKAAAAAALAKKQAAEAAKAAAEAEKKDE